jgi:hypothetical protein
MHSTGQSTVGSSTLTLLQKELFKNINLTFLGISVPYFMPMWAWAYAYFTNFSCENIP